MKTELGQAVVSADGIMVQCIRASLENQPVAVTMCVVRLISVLVLVITAIQGRIQTCKKLGAVVVLIIVRGICAPLTNN